MIFTFPPARESSGSTPRANSPASAGAFYSLPNPFEFESRAKATEGKAGMAGAAGTVRRSTAGTGLRVGAASAVLPTTSEVMDVTAGETALNSSSMSQLDELTFAYVTGGVRAALDREVRRQRGASC